MTNDNTKNFGVTTSFKVVDKRTAAQKNRNNTDLKTNPVRIFVGTWNMAYKKYQTNGTTNNLCCSCVSQDSQSSQCNCRRDSEDPLSEWIAPDYDLYFITLQESVSPNFFEVISNYLSKSPKHIVKVDIKNDRILGFGEGAYVSRKMTSIAVWVREELLKTKAVKIGSSKQVYLSSYNRSKGVVCLQMKVFDQILCFLGCHLPPDYEERQKAYMTVLARLPSLFGANDRLTFKDIFHHVIWAGDFNFKLTMGLKDVIANLLKGTLHHQLEYDEFYQSKSILKDQNFREGDIQFDPTYKKKENRKVLDKEQEGWFDNEYSTRDNKWYNDKTERVPAWTDRVLKWSDEHMESCLEYEPMSYKSVVPKKQTPLLTSDHSPVSCAFHLKPFVKTISIPVKLNVDTFQSY